MPMEPYSVRTREKDQKKQTNKKSCRSVPHWPLSRASRSQLLSRLDNTYLSRWRVGVHDPLNPFSAPVTRGLPFFFFFVSLLQFKRTCVWKYFLKYKYTLRLPEINCLQLLYIIQLSALDLTYTHLTALYQLYGTYETKSVTFFLWVKGVNDLIIFFKKILLLQLTSFLQRCRVFKRCAVRLPWPERLTFQFFCQLLLLDMSIKGR